MGEQQAELSYELCGKKGQQFLCIQRTVREENIVAHSTFAILPLDQIQQISFLKGERGDSISVILRREEDPYFIREENNTIKLLEFFTILRTAIVDYWMQQKEKIV